MSQGQCESRNNVTCFYPHHVNIPSMLNQLSDYIDFIAKEKTTMLNPMVTLYVHEGDYREFNNESEEKNDVEVNLDVESKKASSNSILTSKCKIDKWTTPKTRNTTKIKNTALV